MSETKQNAVVACEIKISLAGRSFEEIRQLLDRIRKVCADNDHKLEINFSGEFFKTRGDESNCDKAKVRMSTVKGAPDGGWIIVAEDPPEDL